MCYRITSVFVEQNCTECDFSGTDSWVILSPIEQSIKRKIEAIGKPLKDWDINIYRGVLTGCNEAFIISKQVRDEILSNCQTPEEYDRTAALIRPILRGRDIKRYSYDWANLWLINSHNGIKGKIPRINIDEYPAVKAHLDKYWSKIKNRADQGDTPYNLRNCAYLEDFSLPKIVYREIGFEMDACIVPDGWFINNKLYLITGKDIEYLITLLNSRIFNKIYLASANLTGGKGVDFMETLLLPNDLYLAENLKDIYSKKNIDSNFEDQIDTALYAYYKLSENEIAFLNMNDE